MKHWCVEFVNFKTNKKEYREYPQMAQWSNQVGIDNELNNRTYLLDYDITKVVLLDLIKEKQGLASEIGKLIYL